jgi:LysM repeat protein
MVLWMPQLVIVTLLLFAFVLPILGAIVLRLLGPRLAPGQMYGAAALLLVVIIASVLVLARGDIPSLQIGNLSILLPVTAPDDSFLPLVPTSPAEQPPAPSLTTSAPVTNTAVLTATVPPLETATSVAPTAAATSTATAEPTAEPTVTPTATPEPTAVPPTAIPPTAAPAPAAQRTYTVQPGDTLLSIAQKFDTTVTAIIEANNLTPQQADALRVGQELVIP